MSDEMVLLAIFGNPVEAELARARLEDEGIRAAVMGATSGDLFAGMGVGVSNVQLLVPAAERERALRVLDAAESALAKELREERERRRREEGRDGEASSTDIRPADVSPLQTSPTPAIPPEPAEGLDEADGFADDEEREERSLTWTPDDIATRAFRAALFGYITCPGVLHLYALWLILRLPFTEGELSPAGTRKAYAGLALGLLPFLVATVVLCTLA
jgi:hypothetical protein